MCNFLDLKNSYFNPKSLNCHTLWWIDRFSIQSVKRAILTGVWQILTYSRCRFFQYEFNNFFSTVFFQKVDGQRRRYVTMIPHSHVCENITDLQ